LIKLGLTIGWLAICNAALGMLMPLLVVTQFGIGVQTDAFFASGALPQFMFFVTSSALTQVLVPILATESDETFRRDAWGFFLGITFIFSLLAVVLYLTAGYWVPFLVPGFSAQAKQLTITLSRIQLISVAGNASIAVLWSAHNARQRFIWPETAQIIANMIALIFLYVTLPVWGITAAVWGTVLGMSARLILLAPFLGRWQGTEWNSPAMREARRRIKPFIFGQIYSRTDPLIDRFLTSMTSTGSLSLLHLGRQAYSAATIVIGKAVTGPTVPKLALCVKRNDWRSFKRIYYERLLCMTGLTAACFVCLLVLGHPLLHFVMGRDGLSAQNVHALWLMLIILSGLLAGGTIGQVITTAFYVLGDTRTPTRIFNWAYTAYLPIKVSVFFLYGLTGLAIATSVHVVVIFLLQFIVLERTLPRSKTSSGRRLSNTVGLLPEHADSEALP
jgi:putative peptidoglycan lipid II flippase